MADPRDVHQRFTDRVNMSVSELKSLKDSQNYAEYQERKSGGQEGTEPIDDAIQLMETPVDDWRCDDSGDGFNECKEANELLSFTSRMSEVDQGEPIPNTEPPVSKRDMSLAAWAVDMEPDTAQFQGDKQLKRDTDLF